jgi:hypothetical protein
MFALYSVNLQQGAGSGTAMILILTYALPVQAASRSLFGPFRSRSDLIVEVLALRQQLAVLRTRKPQPRFSTFDRLFWVLARKW